MDTDQQDLFWEQAKRDAEATGDRYVPVGTFNTFWAVVDAQMQEIVSSGHNFEVALNKAEELSKLNQIAVLESQ
jgi:hypothetical protein